MTFLPFITALILPVSLAAAGAQTEEEAIRQFIEAKYSKQNACDPTYADGYTTADATEILPNQREAQPKDTPASIAEFKAFCEAGGRYHNDVTIRDIDILGGDVALVWGFGHIKTTEPDGEAILDGDYNFSEVLVKTGESWQVRHLHVGPLFEGMPSVAEQD